MSITQNNYIYLPNNLTHFYQTDVNVTEKQIILLGSIDMTSPERREDNDKHEDNSRLKDNGKYSRFCPYCGYEKPIINNNTTINLRHLPIGGTPVSIRLTRKQYLCPHCHHAFQDQIPFKAKHHHITESLRNYIEELLSLHSLTITTISKLTHVHSSIIKSIDKHRLRKQYHTGKNKLGKTICCYKKPMHYSRFLGIDEFSLHKHHQYATVIMDLETGEVLYVADGKKKQVVYNFVKLFDSITDNKFMQHVKAISCDMNAGYKTAFKEECPHLEIIYDHFHIVKHLHDEVIKPIRCEEYERLLKEKKIDEAKSLKNSKYLLLSNYDNLQDKDKQRLDQILEQNKLLFTADLVKDQLQQAYTVDDIQLMTDTIQCIINLCFDTDDTHFKSFANLLQNHLDGIIMHARYRLSTGRVEGTNNKIKTIRRQAYGFRDDEYFFLKILDTTNHRNV